MQAEYSMCAIAWDLFHSMKHLCLCIGNYNHCSAENRLMPHYGYPVNLHRISRNMPDLIIMSSIPGTNFFVIALQRLELEVRIAA